jgi:hypothetical protein
MLKRVLGVFTLLVSLSSTVYADTIQVGVRADDTVTKPGIDQNAFAVDYMHVLSKNVRVGLGFRRIQRDSDNRLTNRFKLRSQFRNLGGIKGFHSQLILGTKERTNSPTTQYIQTQLQYGRRFTNSKFGWQVAYIYRQGVIDANKYDDYFHGPRMQLNYKATDKITYKLGVDRFYLGYDRTPRNRVGLYVQRSI